MTRGPTAHPVITAYVRSSRALRPTTMMKGRKVVPKRERERERRIFQIKSAKTSKGRGSHPSDVQFLHTSRKESDRERERERKRDEDEGEGRRAERTFINFVVY